MIFGEFTFNFDVRCVSRKFNTYSCLYLSQKCLLMRFILSVVLERTVRFLPTVDVTLEQYNNCLWDNIWLSIKNVLIVFGKTFVKVVLTMIRSMSNNTISSSSKGLQNIVRAPSKSASVYIQYFFDGVRNNIQTINIY